MNQVSGTNGASGMNGQSIINSGVQLPAQIEDAGFLEVSISQPKTHSVVHVRLHLCRILMAILKISMSRDGTLMLSSTSRSETFRHNSIPHLRMPHFQRQQSKRLTSNVLHLAICAIMNCD